jgi:lipopolysaccharide transport system ATP-binding protein
MAPSSGLPLSGFRFQVSSFFTAMSDVAIRVENISKQYILQHQVGGRSRYVALRDVLAHKAKSLFQKNRLDASREEFWALKDVSFDIKQGEAVGIIGRNGAGKSTLLKILSRITKPTKGRIEIEGRVASLLEVGTGFHPELTGRENIFLNGAILGMHRAEIKKKFDEIVAFAEVEKFLDTPVKRFSSGMYVRLAFAVAAHLEPEILIVDEVLAVGDMEFQKKCLGKMESVTGQEGRTVLFVSHNMDLISKLCSKAILLNAGKIEISGAVGDVTREYITHAGKLTNQFTAASESRALRWLALDQEALLQGRLVVKIGYRFSGKVVDPTFGIVIYTDGGSPISGSNTMYHPPASRSENQQEGVATVTYDALPLWSGRYTISAWITDGWSPIDHEANAIAFDFISPQAPLNAPSPRYIGPVHLPASWKI